VCEHTDWCLLAADGNAAICARVKSPKRAGDGGWLHRLHDDPFQPQRVRTRTIPVTTSEPRQDFTALAAVFRNAVDPDQLNHLAVALGLSVTSLASLGIGWSASHRAWSFPMTAADGRVLGIRLRRSNGFKFAVTGGKEGLFLPVGDRAGAQMLVSEGATDTSALWDMGFRNLAGRPSCTGGVKPLVELICMHKPSHVVIVADGDEPGQRGAQDFSTALLPYVPLSPPSHPRLASRTHGAGFKGAERSTTFKPQLIRPPYVG